MVGRWGPLRRLVKAARGSDMCYLFGILTKDHLEIPMVWDSPSCAKRIQEAHFTAAVLPWAFGFQLMDRPFAGGFWSVQFGHVPTRRVLKV